MASSGQFNMVAQEGNRRKGGMGNAELKQCVLDVCTWFERNSNEKTKQASTPSIEGLEKSLGCELPIGIALVLEKADGGVWFYERRGLSADEIASQFDKFSLKEGIIPFASDVDGNLYVCDTGKNDAVFEWDLDGRGTEVAGSLNDFLEQLRDDLLSNKFEFVEDCGVVEGVGASAGESKGGK